MQADQKPVIWTVVITALVLLIAGIIGGAAINTNLKLTADALGDMSFDVDEQAIVNAIMAGIVMPEIVIPVSDTNRLCELTPGCEYWEGEKYLLRTLFGADAKEDLFDEVSELLNVDEDFETLRFGDIVFSDIKEYQIRVYSDDDKEDENWELKMFIRQSYEIVDVDDVDSEDWETGFLYLLVTSVLDEGEYDELSIEEVSRRFEFE